MYSLVLMMAMTTLNANWETMPLVTVPAPSAKRMPKGDGPVTITVRRTVSTSCQGSHAAFASCQGSHATFQRGRGLLADGPLRRLWDRFRTRK